MRDIILHLKAIEPNSGCSITAKLLSCKNRASHTTSHKSGQIWAWASPPGTVHTPKSHARSQDRDNASNDFMFDNGLLPEARRTEHAITLRSYLTWCGRNIPKSKTRASFGTSMKSSLGGFISTRHDVNISIRTLRRRKRSRSSCSRRLMTSLTSLIKAYMNLHSLNITNMSEWRWRN